MQDQEILKKYPFLIEAKHTHDAGSFLNTGVLWTGAKLADKYKHPSITLTNYQRKLLKKSTWIQDGVPKELNNIDLSWMKTLDQFDYWDLFTNEGPGKEEIERNVQWHSASPPDYSPLMSLAKLRYLKGLRKGEALMALREIGKFILFIQSNELLISSVVTVTMLGDEAKFYQEAVRGKLIQSNQWLPVTDTDRTVMKRAIWGVAEWISPVTPPEILQTMLEKSESFVGICSGLAERVNSQILINPYFRPRVWLELDMSLNLQRVEHLVNANAGRCRLSYAHAAHTMEKGMPLSLGSGYDFYAIAGYIPLVRRWAGARLFTITSPSWIHLYTEAGRAPAEKE